MLIITAIPWFTVVRFNGGDEGGDGGEGGDAAGGGGDGGDFFTGIRTQLLQLSHVNRRLVALQESSWPSA